MSYYIPFLLVSIMLMFVGYLERNNEKKGIRNPYITGSLGILYSICKMVGLDSLGFIFVIILLVLIGINLIRRVEKV